MGYGFKKEFILQIKAKTKILTFRAIGKRRPPRLGERLFLWYGLRTKHSQKIGEAICEVVEECWIHEDKIKIASGPPIICSLDLLEAIAKMDGFESWEKLKDFHRKENGSLPARRWMICWGQTFEEIAA